MGKWIEIEDGSYPDGFPKSRYKHETCKDSINANNKVWTDRKISKVKECRVAEC